MNFIEQLLRQSPDGARELRRAHLRVAVTEGLALAMQHADISNAELARRLGLSRSAVTQALHSQRNLTLNTLADMADAVGLCVEVTFRPANTQQQASSSMGTAPAPYLIFGDPIQSITTDHVELAN